jgi:hypothetical protein
VKWTMPIRDWGMALNQFAIYFGDRVPFNWKCHLHKIFYRVRTFDAT